MQQDDAHRAEMPIEAKLLARASAGDYRALGKLCAIAAAWIGEGKRPPGRGLSVFIAHRLRAISAVLAKPARRDYARPLLRAVAGATKRGRKTRNFVASPAELGCEFDLLRSRGKTYEAAITATAEKLQVSEATVRAAVDGGQAFLIHGRDSPVS